MTGKYSVPESAPPKPHLGATTQRIGYQRMRRSPVGRAPSLTSDELPRPRRQVRLPVR